MNWSVRASLSCILVWLVSRYTSRLVTAMKVKDSNGDLPRLGFDDQSKKLQEEVSVT